MKEGKKIPNQHELTQCLVSKNSMRYDNLARHMKIHKDLIDLPEEEIETELRLRHKEKVETEGKQQISLLLQKNLNFPY